MWAGSTGTPSCGGTLTAGTLTSAQYTQTFAYDTLTRLTSITSSGATGSSPGSYTYGDSAHLHAATATAGGYSATYDAAGDMVCRAPTSATTCAGGSPTGAQLAYDAERRLTHYQNIPGAAPDVEAWYLYDGAGNRVEQAVKQSGVTTSTYYLAGGAEEVRSDGSLIKYYGGFGLNTGATASTISYLASDGLGSLQVTLNNSGSATAQQLNAPYGSVRYSSGVFPTTKGFTGQRSDAAVSGLDYYGARYYDPRLGQFTSADDAAEGLNLYGYAGGNPETMVDPDGHMTEPPINDPLLKGLIKSLWRATAQVGDGSAMAALIQEAHTGNPVGNSWHYVKNLDARTRLSRWFERKCEAFDTLDSCYGYVRNMTDAELDALIASLESLRQDLMVVSELLSYLDQAIRAWENSPRFVGPGRNPDLPLVQAPPLPAPSPGITRAPAISPSPPGFSPSHAPGSTVPRGLRPAGPIPATPGIAPAPPLPNPSPGFPRASAPPAFLNWHFSEWVTRAAIYAGAAAVALIGSQVFSGPANFGGISSGVLGGLGASGAGPELVK